MLLQKINREMGLTIVLITHQTEVVKGICDRVTVMDAGTIIEQSDVIGIFRHPVYAVTRSLIGDEIAQGLTPGVLQRVRARLEKNGAALNADARADHLFRLTFTGVDRPLSSKVVRKLDLDFNILHGQIEEIQGHAFGSLAILARSSAANIAAAMCYRQDQNVVIDELNHVG